MSATAGVNANGRTVNLPIGASYSNPQGRNGATRRARLLRGNRRSTGRLRNAFGFYDGVFFTDTNGDASGTGIGGIISGLIPGFDLNNLITNCPLLPDSGGDNTNGGEEIVINFGGPVDAHTDYYSRAGANQTVSRRPQVSRTGTNPASQPRQTVTGNNRAAASTPAATSGRRILNQQPNVSSSSNVQSTAESTGQNTKALSGGTVQFSNNATNGALSKPTPMAMNQGKSSANVVPRNSRTHYSNHNNDWETTVDYEPVTCYEQKLHYEPVTTYQTYYTTEPVTSYRKVYTTVEPMSEVCQEAEVPYNEWVYQQEPCGSCAPENIINPSRHRQVPRSTDIDWEWECPIDCGDWWPDNESRRRHHRGSGNQHHNHHSGRHHVPRSTDIDWEWEYPIDCGDLWPDNESGRRHHRGSGSKHHNHHHHSHHHEGDCNCGCKDSEGEDSETPVRRRDAFKETGDLPDGFHRTRLL